MPFSSILFSPLSWRPLFSLAYIFLFFLLILFYFFSLLIILHDFFPLRLYLNKRYFFLYFYFYFSFITFIHLVSSLTEQRNWKKVAIRRKNGKGGTIHSFRVVANIRYKWVQLFSLYFRFKFTFTFWKLEIYVSFKKR